MVDDGEGSLTLGSILNRPQDPFLASGSSPALRAAIRGSLAPRAGGQPRRLPQTRGRHLPGRCTQVYPESGKEV